MYRSTQKDFAYIYGCSTSSEAIRDWASNIQQKVDKKGIEYDGPMIPSVKNINGKSFFRRHFRIPLSERTKPLLEAEPPEEVYVQIGAGTSLSGNVEEIVPDKEIPSEGEVAEFEDESDVSSPATDETTSTTDRDDNLDRDSSKDWEEDEIEPSTEGTEDASSTESTADIHTLREQAEEAAVEDIPESATTTQQTKQQYTRSTEVRDYVLARADGECEGCGEPAPFTSKTGEPYLHAHHIHELSDGGSDTPDTVVALCPNCHYRVHHGEDGEEYNGELLATVQKLETN